MRRGLAIATMALASQSAGHASRELFISDCSGFEGLPTNPMTQDVNLVVENGVETVACNVVTTVIVSGPHTLRVHSNAGRLALKNVRFSIKDNAHFWLDLPMDDIESEDMLDGLATFTGVYYQPFDGGVLDVRSGSSATFSVPVSFEGNSVAGGHSGGAITVEGQVSFKHAAHFVENEAFGGGDEFSASPTCGGAVHIGKGGRIIFSEFVSFEDNWVGNGGRGGAICNMGEALFRRRSFFTGNEAREWDHEQGGGGQGGALFTSQDSKTTFRRKSIMHLNSAGASGGAIHNLGETTFEAAAVFKGNSAAAVAGTVGGGHIFNEGALTVKGDITFREGLTTGNGGAAYTPVGGSTVLKGIVSLDDNIAEGDCNDMYSGYLWSSPTFKTVSSGNVASKTRRRTSSGRADASPHQAPCLP